MNPKYTHDFSSASIKHLIEAEFYQIVGNNLGCSKSATIVTGPDYQRHIDNFRKYIGNENLRICEIDTKIFIGIYQGCENDPKITVINKSIELYGSAFIDCDLTCISDIDVIKKTLLKQIEVQLTASQFKAFVFSVGLRDPNGTHKLHAIASPIFGMLGSQCVSTNVKSSSVKGACGSFLFKKEVRFGTSKSRIKEYKCYCYNAGGGPMLTCLIIYK